MRIQNRAGRVGIGFTLAELLIVIAITLVLAAILTPVVMMAVRTAKTSACASNEKQIQMALIEYGQDNNNTYPPYSLCCDLDVNQTTLKCCEDPNTIKEFIAVLRPYGASPALYRCPLDSQFGTHGTMSLRDSSHYLSSYFTAWEPFDFHLMPVVNLNAITDSSGYCDLADSIPFSYAATHHGQTAHGSYANFAFYDGHVKALPISMDLSPKTSCWFPFKEGSAATGG